MREGERERERSEMRMVGSTFSIPLFAAHCDDEKQREEGTSIMSS